MTFRRTRDCPGRGKTDRYVAV